MLRCTFKTYKAIDIEGGVGDDRWVEIEIDVGSVFYDGIQRQIRYFFDGIAHIALARL